MSKLKKILSNLASGLDDKVDKIAFDLKLKLKIFDPIKIVPYLTYGSQKKIYIKGRVLEDENIKRGEKNDTIWQNLGNMYKRFETDEIPGAKLRIHFQNNSYD